MVQRVLDAISIPSFDMETQCTCYWSSKGVVSCQSHKNQTYCT
jgi:hypothetical protein